MLKKILLFILLSVPAQTFAQRFTNYFTHTLYDSFENPSQGVFKPDSSKMFAFNFLPNFNVNASLTGNSQVTIKQYIFNGKSTSPYLTIGEGKFNHLNANANIYLFMLRAFTDMDGRAEMGISEQIRGEGSAFFGDETVGLFDGGSKFGNTGYDNLFNDKYYYQAYHQLSFSYRETLDKQFAVGVKFSLLSGIIYDQIDIKRSNVTFDKNTEDERSFLTLAGQNRSTIEPGADFSTSNLFPTFKHPGLSVSLGVEQHNEDGVIFQYNIKDLGFIHWNSKSNVNIFDNTAIINLNSAHTGQDLYDAANFIFQQNATKKSFTTVTDGHAEVSATKYFWLDYDKSFKYNPVFIVSKQLFYKGVVGAIVNNVQYKKFTLGVTTTYDDLKQFNMGGQLMYKANNVEVFVGTEQLFGDYNLLKAYAGSNSAINRNSAYTMGGAFFGFSFKFGSDIESPANASFVPMGEEGGFFKRTFGSIFKKKKKDDDPAPPATKGKDKGN